MSARAPRAAAQHRAHSARGPFRRKVQTEEAALPGRACIVCPARCVASPARSAGKRLRAQDSLHDIVQAGKRGEVGDKASKAAYSAYMKLM